MEADDFLFGVDVRRSFGCRVLAWVPLRDNNPESTIDHDSTMRQL